MPLAGPTFLTPGCEEMMKPSCPGSLHISPHTGGSLSKSCAALTPSWLTRVSWGPRAGLGNTEPSRPPPTWNTLPQGGHTQRGGSRVTCVTSPENSAGDGEDRVKGSCLGLEWLRVWAGTERVLTGAWKVDAMRCRERGARTSTKGTAGTEGSILAPVRSSPGTFPPKRGRFP